MTQSDTSKYLSSKAKYSEKIHGPLVAWTILITSLLLTVCAWFISSSYVNQRARDKFEFNARGIVKAIDEQMLVYEQLLRGGVAFFDSSNYVSRQEWKIYVEKLNIEEHWPGIQGLGYSVPVTPQEKEQHIAQIRAEGFPDYSIRPEGERDLYSSIIYLEPFDWRNQRAFGFDMWSNDMRRAAMKRAVETGEATASGLITLVQETDSNIQKGFLVYLPVYKKGMSLKTAEERLNAIQGWVYSPFRAEDLMKGILDSREAPLNRSTFMEIYDEKLDGENLLYSSDKTMKFNNHEVPPINSKIIKLEVQGRNWLVYIYEKKNAIVEGAHLPNYIAVGGVIVDLLLFYVIFALSSIQRRAVNIAKEISGEIEDKNRFLKEKQDEMAELNTLLSERESRINAIVNNTVDGIISINSLGIVISYNKSCEKMFGYTAHEVVGKNIKMLMPEPHSGQHDSYLKNYLETGYAKIIGIGREVNGLKKDGTSFPVDLSINVTQQGNEKIFIGVIRDIKEKKAQEEKIKQVLRDLEKAKENAVIASQSKSEFLANMSHEIRTPMTAILGYIDLLKENETLRGSEAMEQVNIIEKNGDYLLSIINDILDLSKIEAGKLELEFAPLSIFNKVKNIKKLLKAKLAEKELDFKIEYNFPLPKEVIADHTRVRQILINLLGNSIKFTHKGTVTLAVSWLSDKSSLVFEVKDTGIGMTEEQLQKVFLSFEQADNTITRKFGGTGLGLAISKRLTEMMGGNISVQSEYGKGTTFRVEIKATNPSGILVNEEPAEAEKTLVELKKTAVMAGHILLVDDNLTNLTLISKVLKKMNLDVECCMNGQEAVNMLLNKNNNFDAVLMDVQMPVMDGLTAAGILKQNNYDKPVIALTANTMSGDKERCLEAGYNNFASKPIDRKELYDILSGYLVK